MRRIQTMLEHRLFVPLGACVLIATQVVILILLLQSDAQPESLVRAASSAFSKDDEQLGIAMLSAALLACPDSPAALDLYAARLDQRFNEAVQNNDWELAEIQIAAYDSAIRDGLRGATTPNQVAKLNERKEKVDQWNAAVSNSLGKELESIESELKDADPARLQGLDSRFRKIPIDRLSEERREQAARVAQLLVNRQGEATENELRSQLDQLRRGAESEKASTNELRESRVKAEQLHSQVIELQVEDAGGDLGVGTLIASCQELLSQLDQRLQVRSIREAQTISDAEALKAITDAKELHGKAVALSKQGGSTWQACGEKLVEAELRLAHIDRLASLAVQQDARIVSEAVKRDALIFRANQQRQYNLWAIEQLQTAIGDYKKAKGLFDDNEKEFMRILEQHVGAIDPQHLHPVTYALFSEMYQKLLSELNNDQRLAVTKTVERASRRNISDF